MGRPRSPRLSRDRILDTALALIDADGLDALSTRRLAAELGVSSPSLYNHFATKDEILHAAVDRVEQGIDLGCLSDGTPWPDALRQWAHAFRAALAAHPHLVPFLARGPVRRPASLRIADAVYGLLTEAGWPPAQATGIGAAMRYFITGSSLASFAGGFEDDPDLYTADYPHLGQAHKLRGHRRDVDDGAFALGLDAMLDGLRARYEAL